MKTLSVLFCALALCLSGCVTDLNSDISPGADLSALKTFYVQKFPAYERGVEQLISDRLNLMGFKSTYGSADTPPEPVDAIITYQDHWMWDITMYMIELDVQVRDGKDRTVLAFGHSYRTSMARKSPEGMVEEVLGQIFAGVPAR